MKLKKWEEGDFVCLSSVLRAMVLSNPVPVLSKIPTVAFDKSVNYCVKQDLKTVIL